MTIVEGPALPTLTEELESQRAAFYREIGTADMAALWNVLQSLLTPEPNVRAVPVHWRWSDVRPRVLRSGELVTAAEAERRVLYFLNPALPREMHAVTNTLYAGIQLILPGEVAVTHRHTPSAIRFIIEGELGYTTVSGERGVMRKGDFLTTPIWSWHDHGNQGSQPVMWLDGLDIPLVTNLDAVFFTELLEDGHRSVQRVERAAEDSIHRYGANMRPAWRDLPQDLYSPVVNYPWSTSRAALHALRDDPASPFDGVILEYINPQTGRAVLPTMSAYLQLLRKGERTRAHRHVASTVYHVAEGGGTSIVGGQQFDWQAGDTFVVPAWSWHEHASTPGEEAVLFSFSDRPTLRAFGLDREEPHPNGHQA